jgi:cold shock protein
MGRMRSDNYGCTEASKELSGCPRMAANQFGAKKMQGTVAWFNESKGYGFLRSDGGEKTIYVHQSGLIDMIRDGQRVEFEIRNGKKDQEAYDVRLLQ